MNSIFKTQNCQILSSHLVWISVLGHNLLICICICQCSWPCQRDCGLSWWPRSHNLFWYHQSLSLVGRNSTGENQLWTATRSQEPCRLCECSRLTWKVDTIWENFRFCATSIWYNQGNTFCARSNSGRWNHNFIFLTIESGFQINFRRRWHQRPKHSN